MLAAIITLAALIYVIALAYTLILLSRNHPDGE